MNLAFETPLVVGLSGPRGSGAVELLRLIAGQQRPESGVVEGFENAALAEASFTSADPAEIQRSIDEALSSAADVILIGPSLALADAVFQHGAMARIQDLKRRGRWIFLASQDLSLLERRCDEVVVMRDGAVSERGDPQETIRNYRAWLIEQYKKTAGGEVRPVARHGDERVRVGSIEIHDAAGRPVQVVQSGERITVLVTLEFLADVAEPVAGILIRSRVGINVYGTNTELEKVSFGPCRAGEHVELRFSFDCNLCAEQYTLTVASHDPDGVAHDWLEEAIFFTVADTRYTAGVANLRASVEVEKK
ncbi:MAG: Wzt carbohydrate-binding domain-containing protein [Acidobacteria bacterium]|nr:Wzt carbohydrate-binding domain-containing protein [Acidobacteriota bacterium]